MHSNSSLRSELKTSESKILFLAEGQLGDLLLLTPAIRAVKESFPTSFISVLVLERRNSHESKSNPFSNLTATQTEKDSSVLSTNPNVDELLVLNRQALRSLHGSDRVKAELSIITFLRRRKFDAVICTFPEDRFAQWAFASGARVRVGQRKQGFHWLLSHRPDIEKSERGVLEYYCDLVRAIGVNVRSTQTEFTVPEASRLWAETLLYRKGIAANDRLIAIHPGASGDYKIWPPERYAALINHLKTTLGAIVILLHGNSDAPVVEAIKENLQCEIVEAETGSNVGNLAALLRRSSLCITNDSGPRHLAIAVGAPSLAFFRQHHDREWGVYREKETCVTLKSETPCSMCPSGICLDKNPDGERFGSQCIRFISVDEAIRQCEKMFARTLATG